MADGDTSAVVLVVDDEPDLRETLGMRLELEGYEVISAANGKEALGAVESEQPACQPDRQTFAQIVSPFLKTHCLRCHGPETQEGDFAMHTLSGDIAGGESLDRWTEIAARLKAGDMPPTDEPQPDPKNAA